MTIGKTQVVERKSKGKVLDAMLESLQERLLVKVFTEGKKVVGKAFRSKKGFLVRFLCVNLRL
jgi:hypothetical protein